MTVTEEMDDALIKKIMYRVIFTEREFLAKDEQSVTKVVQKLIGIIKKYVDKEVPYED